jgi:PAS domain S-box-containing protein
MKDRLGERTMVAAPDKVLIVDDEESVRELLATTLTEAGYETLAVSSANEAISRLEQGEDWDLVLTDLRMPGMSGEMLLEHVDREFPSVATVVMTGYPSCDSVSRAARARASDYLEKPFSDLGKVLEQIGRVLAERRRAVKGDGESDQLSERLLELERENRLLSRRLEYTQRNLNEQFRSLRRSREFFYNDLSRVMAIFDNLGDGIVCTDGDGKVILINPAAGRMLEAPPFAAIGKRLGDVAGNKDLLQILRTHRETDPGNGGVESAVSTTREDAGDRYYTVRTSALQDFKGNWSTVLSLVRDESLRKRTEQLKNQFLSIVAHELRTPLTSIKAFATIMDKGIQGELPESLKPLLGNILTQSERLGHEIDKIISLGLLQSGGYLPDLQEVGTPEILKGLLLPFAAGAEAKDLKLVSSDESGGAQTEADLHNIRRALRSLLENAVKFTPEGGRVELRAVAEEENVRFEVRDTGIGIAPKDHAVIFEEFTQLENPLTRHYGGSGLGLSFAAGIVRAHDSEVEVDSTLGNGATFRFRLRRIRGEEDPEEQDRAPGSEDSVGGSD